MSTPHRDAGPAAPPHYLSLDGLRGVAVLLVMLHHFAVFVPGSRAEQMLLAATRSAWLGVDLFFVLSGFLITGILLRSRGRPRYFSSFFARRVLRIFPLYYAVIAVALLVLPAFPPARQVLDTPIGTDHGWWYALYLQNILMAVRASFDHLILAVTWSLAVEEQFYLLWPVVVWWLPARRLAWLCGGLMLAAPLLRGIMVALDSNAIAIYVLTPTRVDALAAGSFIACWLDRSFDPERLRRFAKSAGTVSLLGIGGLLAVRGRLRLDDPLMQTAGYSLIAVGGAALLTLLLQPAKAPRLVRCFSFRPLLSLGRYSYAMYLFHVPLGAINRKGIWGIDDAADTDSLPEVLPMWGDRLHVLLAMMASSVLLTFAAAWLSWHLYEKHFLRLKRYFPRATD